MANVNVTIYFDSPEKALEWAAAHPSVVLTIWGTTKDGKKLRGSFSYRTEESEDVIPVV